jgi:hypothetical protein
VGVGLIFGGAMLFSDIGDVRSLIAATSPEHALIFLAGSVMTIFPLVLATVLGAKGRNRYRDSPLRGVPC